ncbi:MAG: Do family serine endopeptidase [Bacteroidia bacterium]
MKKIINVFAVAFLGGITALSANYLMERSFARNNSHNQLLNPISVKMVNLPSAAPEVNLDFTKAAAMSVEEVVHINTTYPTESAQGNWFYDPFHNFIYGGGDQGQQMPQMASGSGVIISSDGYIVTNNHVVDKANKIEVTLNDKRTYEAKVIGKDPTTDLALLKVDDQNLPFMTYGNSDEVKVGQWVLAVGNPFNLTSTVTAGIISAKGRNINILPTDPAKGIYPIEAYLQTDAAVNPGNSGGALVNTSGQLVGINSAIASNTGSYTGYSFAVPVNIVKKVVADLLEYGTVQRAYLGVSIKNLDANLAKQKNISNLQGVYVSAVTQGGAAENAGIKAGDVITKVGDELVNEVSELEEQISKFRPGDKVVISLRRDNQEMSIPLILKNSEGTTSIVKTETPESISVLGASFQPASKEEKQNLNIENGLKITSLDGGKLRSAGIQQGFIITRVDKQKINSVNDLKLALDKKQGGGVLIEGVYPNGMRAYYGFGL